MQSKNGRCMAEEKPNAIYYGERQGNKCVCKQENSSSGSHRLQSTAEETGYSAEYNSAAFAKGKFCSGKSKKKAMLQCCQNVAAESRGGHPKEPAVTLLYRALWKRNFGKHNWMLLGMVIEH